MTGRRHTRAVQCLAVGALALAGVLLAHGAGYRVASLGEGHAHAEGAGAHHHVAHGHLLPVASGSALLAAVAVVALLAGAHRRRLLPPLRVDVLLGVQVALYTALEVLERALQGVDPFLALTDRKVLTALALQAPVAVLLGALARAGARAIERFFGGARPPIPGDRRPPRRLGSRPFVRPAPLGWALGGARRGPPVSVPV